MKRLLFCLSLATTVVTSGNSDAHADWGQRGGNVSRGLRQSHGDFTHVPRQHRVHGGQSHGFMHGNPNQGFMQGGPMGGPMQGGPIQGGMFINGHSQVTGHHFTDVRVQRPGLALLAGTMQGVAAGLNADNPQRHAVASSILQGIGNGALLGAQPSIHTGGHITHTQNGLIGIFGKP